LLAGTMAPSRDKGHPAEDRMRSPTIAGTP
jgi:hypothetical protein